MRTTAGTFGLPGCALRGLRLQTLTPSDGCSCARVHHLALLLHSYIPNTPLCQDPLRSYSQAAVWPPQLLFDPRVIPTANHPPILALWPSTAPAKGLTAASAALRGALFEATGRGSPGPGSGPGSTARPLSATTIALMMSPGPGPMGTGAPLLLPSGPSGTLPGAPSTSTRGSPGTILGFLSAGALPPGIAAIGGAGGTGGGGPGGGVAGLAHEAAQSATALRAAAEGLAEALEAAVRAREAQNRAMLT